MHYAQPAREARLCGEERLCATRRQRATGVADLTQDQVKGDGWPLGLSLYLQVKPAIGATEKCIGQAAGARAEQ